MLLEISYLLPLIIIGGGAVVLMLLSPIKYLKMEQFSWITFGIIVLALMSNLVYFGELRTMLPFQNIFSKMIIDDTDDHFRIYKHNIYTSNIGLDNSLSDLNNEKEIC